MEDKIINRVEKSALVQVDLDHYYPQGDRVLFDIKGVLHNELVLIEKDLRAFVKENDWSVYKDKYVGVVCSSDAIVPLWAFMLIASEIDAYSKKVVFGGLEDLEKAIFSDVFSEMELAQYRDKSVIVKGCGKFPIPESVFIDFVLSIKKYAKNVMFGEACSAVPLYKKKTVK